MELVRLRGIWMLSHFSKYFTLHDRPLVLELIQSDPNSLSFLSHAFGYDKEIVLAAGHTLQNDEEFREEVFNICPFCVPLSTLKMQTEMVRKYGYYTEWMMGDGGGWKKENMYKQRMEYYYKDLYNPVK